MTKIEELIQEAERLKNERRGEPDKEKQVAIWRREYEVLMELERIGYKGEKTTKTYSEKFSQYIIEGRGSHLSYQESTRYLFPNGYYASVIYGVGSYGLEVEIMRRGFMGRMIPVYDSPLTDDVIGDIEDLDEVLEQIKNL